MVKKNKKSNRSHIQVPCRHCSMKQDFHVLRKHENLCPQNLSRRNTQWKRRKQTLVNMTNQDHVHQSSNFGDMVTGYNDNIHEDNEIVNNSVMEAGLEQLPDRQHEHSSSSHHKPYYDDTCQSGHPYKNWVDERIAIISATHNIFGIALDNIITLIRDVSDTNSLKQTIPIKISY